VKHYSRVCAEIDLDAIAHNMQAMHNLLNEETKIFAVIKTDGYGHGAVEIAHEIESYEYVFGFCVATTEEAVILRKHGVKKPILILGYTFKDQYPDIVRYDLRPSVFTLEMAQELSNEACRQQKNVYIHLKIDTGMSRIGLQVNEENAILAKKISENPNLKIEGIFTHFAKADELDKSFASKQMNDFHRMIQMLEEHGLSIPYKHCSNSAGIVDLPEANMDFVRAGITLYGLWPSSEVHKERIDLKPVLTLKSQVIYVKNIEKGTSISYGGTYTADTTRKIATVPVGYGDGYPRTLSNKGWVLIHGKKAPIRGRICMDQFMVDVTDILDVKQGDEVILIGHQMDETITMEEMGDLSMRFNYEFACDLGKRIPRAFVKNNQIISTKDYFEA